ncbi:MAG: CTP synthase [Candidatus Pacebacteria bacterium]|nr:CTP synthase [Candidatus Paceibacterota bacterium]
MTTTRRKGKKTQHRKVPPKFIFVVGGVMSGVGKGIASSSIAKILQARGLTVTAMKIDPYVNVDAGTMNPTEHGEVFVLQNGLETDQDMGNYERFLNIDIPDINYMTTGSVYASVIRKERNLEYGGRNVQVVPDIPAEAIRRIKNAAAVANADVTLIEVGGTVGEYENILFMEAIRMMKSETPNDVAVVMLSYLPVPGSVGEMKTKPTQHASRTLNSTGVSADFILARAPIAVDKKRREKIARFCNVKLEHVISAPDVASIYDVPLNFEKGKLSDQLCGFLGLQCSQRANLSTWKRFVRSTQTAQRPVKIAVVGKYFNSGDFVLSDVYISVLEAIKYSAYSLGLQPEISYVSSVDFEDRKNLKKLKQYDGVLIPGGFGTTGIAGKLNVIEYVRKNNIPYFGICYGMQLAVLEFAKNKARLKDASTAEINPKAAHLVIDIMEEQKEKLAQKDMGGTMRLGEYPASLKKGTIAAEAYKKRTISERHRHRYEVNPAYIQKLENKGVVFSGTSPDGTLMEIMELPQEVHPFFVGVQFHPEFHARPLDPHPLFTAFVKASFEHIT